MHYCGLNFCDTANGPGVRISLFISGCTLQCKGCFNPESWSFTAGHPLTEDVIQRIELALQDPFIQGISVLGGDPMEPQHQAAITELLARLKGAMRPDQTLWVWTGRRYEKLLEHPALVYIDTLVDGPFVEKRKITTPRSWRGSDNQRILPLKAGKRLEEIPPTDAQAQEVLPALGA